MISVSIRTNSFTKVNGMDTFRQYIEKRQEELGLSQNRLAKRAGKTGSWLNRFLSGDRKDIKVETLISLAKALEISDARLMAAYKGNEPDKIEDSPEIEASVMNFLNNLPLKLVFKAILANPKIEDESLIVDFVSSLPRQLVLKAISANPSIKEVESSVVDFMSHLPGNLVMEALLSRPEEEVFANFVKAKGPEKVREIMQKVRNEMSEGENQR